MGVSPALRLRKAIGPSREADKGQRVLNAARAIAVRMKQVLLIFSGIFALLLSACSQPSGPYQGEVDRPVDVVRAALLEVDGSRLNEDFSLPSVKIGEGRDGSVLWEVPTGNEMAGQLQIRLTAIGGGRQTRVTAVYAPAALSAAAAVVPGLHDPNIIGDLLKKAVAARITALGSNIDPAVTRRNTTLSSEYLTAARIAANPTAISEGIGQAFNNASQLMSEYADDMDTPSSDAAPPPPTNDADFKYGGPMVDPTPPGDRR